MGRIIFVMKDIGRSGGAKNIYEICQRLSDKYEVEICCLTSKSDWYGKVNFKITNLGSPGHVIEYLKKQEAIKIATWWETAEWVARSGGGYYFVQDIESSYYKDKALREAVLSTYRMGLKCLTINSFQEAVLRLVFNCEVVNIGEAIDHEIFKPKKYKKERIVLYCYREHFLKNPRLFERSVAVVKRKAKDIIFYSYGMGPCPAADYNFINITDTQLSDLMNKAGVFISTSVHEGFCLPILEAMACGLPVVTTRSTGNQSFCINGVNCLMAEDEKGIAQAVIEILGNAGLAKRLSNTGIETAKNYTWPEMIKRAEDFLNLARIPKEIEEPIKGLVGIPASEIFIKRIRENDIFIVTRDGRKFSIPK